MLDSDNLYFDTRNMLVAVYEVNDNENDNTKKHIQELHYVNFLPFTLCHALWKLAKGGWIQDQDTQKRFYFL